jgi:hypothetical protein
MFDDAIVLAVGKPDNPFNLIEAGEAVADLPVPVAPVRFGGLGKKLVEEIARMLADGYAAYNG